MAVPGWLAEGTEVPETFMPFLLPEPFYAFYDEVKDGGPGNAGHVIRVDWKGHGDPQLTAIALGNRLRVVFRKNYVFDVLLLDSMEALGMGPGVWVQDADGVWVNLSSLDSRNWIVEASWEESIDQPGASAIVEAFQALDAVTRNLSPMAGDSDYNKDVNDVFSPLVVPGRGLRIVFDDGIYFDGEIDKVGFPGRLHVECRDRIATFMDSWLEFERHYDAGIMEEVIQQMLDDQFGADVYKLFSVNGTDLIPFDPADTPNAGTSEFTAKPGSIGEAVRNIPQQIGWHARWIPDPSDPTKPFRFTLYSPERDRTPEEADATFEPSDYLKVRDLAVSRIDVRNVVRVYYTDGATGARANITRKDDASIAKYKRRYMEISLEENSQIDSAVEAQQLADAALADLKEPIADKEVEMHFRPESRIGDFYHFTPNPLYYSDDQYLAVVRVRHVYRMNERRTMLTLRGQVAGSYREWLRRSNPGGGTTEDPSSGATPSIYLDANFYEEQGVGIGVSSTATCVGPADLNTAYHVDLYWDSGMLNGAPVYALWEGNMSPPLPSKEVVEYPSYHFATQDDYEAFREFHVERWFMAKLIRNQDSQVVAQATFSIVTDIAPDLP